MHTVTDSDDSSTVGWRFFLWWMLAFLGFPLGGVIALLVVGSAEGGLREYQLHGEQGDGDGVDAVGEEQQTMEAQVQFGFRHLLLPLGRLPRRNGSSNPLHRARGMCMC